MGKSRCTPKSHCAAPKARNEFRPRLPCRGGTAMRAGGRRAERSDAHRTIEATTRNGTWCAIQCSTSGIVAAVKIERYTRHHCGTDFCVVGQIRKVRDVYIHRRRRADLKNALQRPPMQCPFHKRRLHAERRRVGQPRGKHMSDIKVRRTAIFIFRLGHQSIRGVAERRTGGCVVDRVLPRV